MLILVMLLLALSSQTEQVSPRDRGSVSNEGTAVVRGRVIDAESGAPLARVDVSLTFLAGRDQFDTASDADGAFAVDCPDSENQTLNVLLPDEFLIVTAEVECTGDNGDVSIVTLPTPTPTPTATPTPTPVI